MARPEHFPKKARRMSALLILSFATIVPALGKTDGRAPIPDGVRLSFQVVNIDEYNPDDFSFSKEISDVTASDTYIHLTELGGKRFFLMEKTDQLRGGDKMYWKFYLDPQHLGLVRLEKKIVSRSGATVNESWYDYRDEMYDYPKNLCYMYTIPVWLMGKDLKIGGVYDFYLLLSYNGSPMHMYATVEGEAKVTVPAGTFDCYKITLEPYLKEILGKWSWASSIISPFVPDYTFWVTKGAPHAMVRFEGKFGPVGGTPTQAYELLSKPSMDEK